MADKVTIEDALGVNQDVATDAVTIGGVDVEIQRVKPSWGVDGSAVDVSATDPLPTSDGTTHTSLATLVAALADPATETTAAAILSKLSSDPATQTTLAAALVELQAINASTDGLEALLGGTLTTNATVQNWPATQAVSAASLPLPSGAAKDSTLTDGSARIGGTVAVSGTFWQATQPVSLASAIQANSGLTLGDSGRKTSTSVGTAVALPTVTCKFVRVTALLTNTQQVNTGGASVLAVAGSSTGDPLLAGDSTVYVVSNLNQIYLDVRVSGEGVSYTYWT